MSEPSSHEGLETLLLLACAFILPPLAVAWHTKQLLGIHFLLNCVLTFFLWVPGVVHAVLVVLGTERHRS